MLKILPMAKASHWETGKAGRIAGYPPYSTSQKTYGSDLSCASRVYGALRLSQKNGCGTIFGAAAVLFFGGMTMNNKKLIIALATVVAIIAIFLGIYFATRPETTQGAKAFTVTVIHADGSAADFTYHTDEEYLGAAVIAEGLIEGEEGPYGMYIKVVDGEKAVYEEGGAYWCLYVGEEYATQGIDLTPVNDGDTFKLVYTIG